MIEPTTLAGHLDTSILADLRALGSPGDDVLGDVTRLFLADAPGQLSALAAAIGAGDAQAVWRIAHSLKGSSLAIGAWRLAKICGVVEYAARDEALHRAAAPARELHAEFQFTRLALEQAVGS